MMKNNLTLDNFSETNREVKIGHSTYRVCKNGNGMWYVYEVHNNPETEVFAMAHGFYRETLEEVLEIVNGFKKEFEVFCSYLEK